MAIVLNGVETLTKISIAWVGCTNVTDDRQTDRQYRRQTTDGRRHIANVNVSGSRSLKMLAANNLCVNFLSTVAYFGVREPMRQSTKLQWNRTICGLVIDDSPNFTGPFFGDGELLHSNVFFSDLGTNDNKFGETLIDHRWSRRTFVISDMLLITAPQMRRVSKLKAKFLISSLV